MNIALTSLLSSKMVNEVRVSFLRYKSQTLALDPSSELIPSIEITELGLTGFNAATNRTAIGLGINLPQSSVRNTYQLQDTVSYSAGNHSLKFGVDIHRSQLHQLFKPSVRGRLSYTNLNRFVADVANTSIINKDLPGVARILHLDWYDGFFFAQDEWKVTPNFTLTYGLRYERPGQPIEDLAAFHAPVFAASGNNPQFHSTHCHLPIPTTSNHVLASIGTFARAGMGSGSVFGGDKTVLRGGILAPMTMPTPTSRSTSGVVPVCRGGEHSDCAADSRAGWQRYRQRVRHSLQPTVQSGDARADGRRERISVRPFTTRSVSRFSAN